MGARDLDLSLYKTFPIGENKSLRFEVSSYNVTNRAQFGMPNVPTLTVVSAAPQHGCFRSDYEYYQYSAPVPVWSAV